VVTIKDVARLAEVSVSTVSNALNDSPKVVPETKAKVLEAARHLGYVPNLNARRLKNRRTGNLGLFLPNFGGTYYVHLTQAMYLACQDLGYSLLVHISDSLSSEALVSVILSSNIDGAVVLNEHLEAPEVPLILNREMPVVFLDKDLRGSNHSCVLIDNAQGIRACLEYLRGIGHRRITLVRGFPNFDEAQRFEAFEAGVADLGLEVDKVLWGWFSAETACQEILRAKDADPDWTPTAILCVNDDMAKGAFDALDRLGLRVPDDTSVVGFDNLDFASEARPRLTTVENPVDAVGRTAIAELVRLQDSQEEGRMVVLPTRLVLRDSCRPQLPQSTSDE
jgi:LacI family purine nucleotide synthesis repressor